jgi:hypothetical protein
MSVIKHVQVDHILALNRIGDFINKLN